MNPSTHEPISPSKLELILGLFENEGFAMKVDPQLFRKVVGTFATGVTILSTMDSAGVPYGVTVNSFTSVSLDPLLILVCLDNRLSGLQTFLESGRFVVNILGEDQEDVSNHFAAKGSDRSRIDAVSESGIPVIDGAISRLECSLREAYPAGDHTILLGQVNAVRLADETEGKGPLVFFQGKYRRIDTPHQDPAPPLLGSRAAQDS